MPVPTLKPNQAKYEQLLQELPSSVAAKTASKKAVWKRISAQIEAPVALTQLHRSVSPQRQQKTRIWQALHQRIEPLSVSFWDSVRSALTPSSGLAAQILRLVRSDMLAEPVPVRAFRAWQWTAAVCAVLIVARVASPVFLPSSSIAQSTATVFATRGHVSVLIGGLWQPLQSETILTPGMQLRTDDGEATLTFYDDAVVRMAPHALVTVTDLTDRPRVPQAGSALLVQKGQVWVLGLIPTQLAPMQLMTHEGRVVVGEGSTSIFVQDNNEVVVTVWDRSTTVARRDQSMTLVAGEQVQMSSAEQWPVHRFDSNRYAEPWVASNLDRDAVHQHEIAQLQQERRAAQAGILPDSTLYGAKRFAEQFDVFLTFSPEERVRKQLEQANTRLSEAAALLKEGKETEAKAALAEFQSIVAAVGQENTVDSNVSELIEQEVISLAASDLAAALPNDPSYILKQAVEQSIQALPDTIAKPDIDSEAVLDTLTLLRRQANDGEAQAAEQRLSTLKLALITSGEYVQLSDGARASLTALEEYFVPPTEDTLVLPTRSGGISASPSDGKHRTQAEIFAAAVQIRNRILYTYRTHEGREQWLHLEANRLGSDPDKGSILRQLRIMLPDGLRDAATAELHRFGASVRSASSSAEQAETPSEPSL